MIDKSVILDLDPVPDTHTSIDIGSTPNDALSPEHSLFSDANLIPHLRGLVMTTLGEMSAVGWITRSLLGLKHDQTHSRDVRVTGAESSGPADA